MARQKLKFERPFGNPERLEEVKTFIRAYWEKWHYSPSNQEIAEYFNVSTNTSNNWTAHLEHDGWLEPRNRPGIRVARNLVPVEIFANRSVFPGIVIVGVDKSTGEDYSAIARVIPIPHGAAEVVDITLVEKKTEFPGLDDLMNLNSLEPIKVYRCPICHHIWYSDETGKFEAKTGRPICQNDDTIMHNITNQHKGHRLLKMHKEKAELS